MEEENCDRLVNVRAAQELLGQSTRRDWRIFVDAGLPRMALTTKESLAIMAPDFVSTPSAEPSHLRRSVLLRSQASDALGGNEANAWRLFGFRVPQDSSDGLPKWCDR